MRGVAMSKYAIQFQKGLSIFEFNSRFSTREQCEEKVFKLKWGDRFTCPKCGHHHSTSFQREKRTIYQCCSCNAQTSLLVGTIFQRTHLPLTFWFTAIYLISTAKTSISSLDLHRKLGINHKSAHLLLQKVMEAMYVAEKNHKLCGRIEMDDSYLGGKLKGGTPGRGSENKQPFIAAVQTDEKKHPLYLKLDPVETFSIEEVKRWTKEHIHPGSYVVSDGLSCFSGVEESCTHEIHTASKMTEEEKERHFKWVNTVLANVKTALAGTFHSFECHKYSNRYLASIVYRFNRRWDLSKIFFDLCGSCVNSPPFTAQQLSR